MKEKQLVLIGTIVLMLAMALTGCDAECGSSRSSSNNGETVTTLGTGWYLSSSCVDYYYAWTQHFTNGELGNYMKYNECYVRAVQAF